MSSQRFSEVSDDACAGEDESALDPVPKFAIKVEKVELRGDFDCKLFSVRLFSMCFVICRKDTSVSNNHGISDSKCPA